MKKVTILIGLKGSGKTHIGQLLQEKLNIYFLRVEDICLKIQAGRKISDIDYISEVFTHIEAEVRKLLCTVNHLTIESTGSVPQFDQMLTNLKKDFIVKLIKVNADPGLCLQRVKTRDQKNHIVVSDNQVIEINNAAAQKTFDFDLIIENNNLTDEELLKVLSLFFYHNN